jgi:hypothetical protein
MISNTVLGSRIGQIRANMKVNIKWENEMGKEGMFGLMAVFMTVNGRIITFTAKDFISGQMDGSIKVEGILSEIYRGMEIEFDVWKRVSHLA